MYLSNVLNILQLIRKSTLRMRKIYLTKTKMTDVFLLFTYWFDFHEEERKLHKNVEFNYCREISAK